jgi:flavin reductase (DIM6/NTAB) family NADH-FMN oxidoreductase RutF
MIDDHLLKDTLARWASGVTVVTTIHEGQFKGTTASSFSSVSIQPPLVLICLAQKLYTHTLLQATAKFAINILAEDQRYVGELFAGMHPEVQDRFSVLQVQTGETGCPLIIGSAGWLECITEQEVTAGDHTIFIGRVVAADASGSNQPLVYHNRQWGGFRHTTG